MAFMTLFSVANAQTSSPDTAALHFLTKASIGNLQEIASGKLAVQKAGSPDVKAFGQMMVDDHSKTQAKLLQVAKSHNISLPTEATQIPVADMMLSKASIKDFNRLYVHAMAAGHKQTVLMFQFYAVQGKNEAVKDFAVATLPNLKQHLAMVKALDEKIKFAVAK